MILCSHEEDLGKFIMSLCTTTLNECEVSLESYKTHSLHMAKVSVYLGIVRVQITSVKVKKSCLGSKTRVHH